MLEIKPMAQTIMFTDCQPPFFSTKKKFQKLITALSLNSTHLKKQSRQISTFEEDENKLANVSIQKKHV